MAQTITINVTDSIALEESKEVLKHGKLHKPSWWKEAKDLNYDVTKCPSVVDVINNSIVFCAPTDIEVKWDDNHRVQIRSAANIKGWNFEPIGTTFNINEDSEALPYYKFSGGSINFRIELVASITGSDNKTVRTVWMPPTLFQEDSVNKRYSTTPGAVNFPPTWPVAVLAMVSVNLNNVEGKSNRFIIKKGEVLGIYYFIDGISKLNYNVSKDIPTHTISKIAPGANYLIESGKYMKCPVTSRWNKIKSWITRN